MPGLADMHVHLYSDDETPDSLAPDELGVMLANGVTTIRLMIGTPESLVERDVAPQQFTTMLTTCFALLALLLAAVGVYGVMS
jgi:hypothetical protein